MAIENCTMVRDHHHPNPGRRGCRNPPHSSVFGGLAATTPLAADLAWLSQSHGLLLGDIPHSPMNHFRELVATLSGSLAFFPFENMTSVNTNASKLLAQTDSMGM